MANGRKTGGRRKGVPNKPKLFVSPEQLAKDRAIALMTPDEIRTPKAVMLSAMMKFERMSDVLMAKAERMTGDKAAYEDIKQVVAEAHKFTFAAVNCADRVAPYIHARLLAVESRGDMTEDKAPFVVRVPAVVADSKAWQAVVGSEILDMEAAQAASAPRTEVLAHPAMSGGPVSSDAPGATPAPAPVVLAVDPKTSRITAMPPGPKIVQPVGAQEWLDAVAAERRKAAG